MTGGLLQLVAYGYENVYLTEKPHITFFKITYRRHTNFSTELFSINPDTSPGFNKSTRFRLFRLGDLITSMYLFYVSQNIYKCCKY
jgi:hypothetical protein